MDEDISRLIFLLYCLMRRRQAGIRMSLSEKTRFISLLYEYFIYKIQNEYYIRGATQGADRIFIHSIEDYP